MGSLRFAPAAPHAAGAASTLRLSPDEMWSAFLRRDRRYDGRFVTGVRTTRIFCRPTCSCRKPRRERVIFFASPSAASAAGFRPCKRCRPELKGGTAEADAHMVERVLGLVRARLEERWTLGALARSAHMSASGFARRFRAAAGRTPMRALADLRAERAEVLLADHERSVLEIGLAVGFGSPAAFGRAFRRRHRCSPAAWRRARPKAGRGGRA